MLLPLEMMWRRVELARDDSDTTFFLHLLYAGEMVTKLVTAGFVAAVADERERHRYRLVHKLIRSDGLGDWAQSLEEVLVGPPAQHLLDAANEDRRSLTERFHSGTWQYEAVECLLRALRAVAPNVDASAIRLPLRQWFSSFVALRNSTRGHGATTPAICAKLSPDLERSVKLLVDNLPLFQRPWAYLHRNLSGKYRVIPLGGDSAPFEPLKTAAASVAFQRRSLNDGVHLYLGEFARVELLDTSLDTSDFFFPNGGFKGATFEWLSLISDNRKQGDASPYLAPAGERPPSETQGKGDLDVLGETFTNLPPEPQDYVPRPPLEDELHEALKDDRHPVVTLVGSGGIGKTCLVDRI